ncbi:MAG: 4-hydroxy-tetrahydrodipicolinate synthase [Candidatus Thermoplasmatota archaeon]|nr:4-hydroxy-tetrahydrodipicolinate synthase [Candidatus Thermoplasmatota archaeon]
MFEGVYTALVTPFKEDGSLDFEALRAIVEMQNEAGVDGIIPCATTGESPTLTGKERIQVIKTVIEHSKSAKVIAGAGTNSTEKSTELVREAGALGVDGVLSVCPYYNKPTQRGLYEHFTDIASVGLPIIMYNVPGRTGCNMSAETAIRLSSVPNIAGIKEASGDFQQIMKILEGSPKSFSVLSGDDAYAYPMMCLGGKGVVSVASNLVPKEMVKMVHAALEGRFEDAKRIHYRLLPLFRGLFIETNPIPVKEAMNMCGIRVGGFRLPLCTMEEKNRKSLREILVSLNLMEA